MDFARQPRLRSRPPRKRFVRRRALFLGLTSLVSLSLLFIITPSFSRGLGQEHLLDAAASKLPLREVRMRAMMAHDAADLIRSEAVADQKRRLENYVNDAADRGVTPAFNMTVFWSYQPVIDVEAGLKKERRIPIASLTKSFTALAIMQLAENGHIDLDRPVAEYGLRIPGAFTGKGAITTRHLLQQTSGIFYGSHSQSVPAGEQFMYANGNYAHLARLIELISGIPAPEYLRTNILVPLRMDDTTIARSYSGSSGIASTAADLTRFAMMLQAGGYFAGEHIVAEETLHEMLQPPPYLRKRNGTFYAHGFRVDLSDGELVSFYHAGIWNGCFAEVRVFPKLNAFLISMATPKSYANEALNGYRWQSIQLAHKFLKSINQADHDANAQARNEHREL